MTTSPMAEFVTVAVFTLPHEYAVVKARMESEGILCFAKDESTVSAHPFYSNVVGGIKLQVPAEHVRHARDILLEAGVVTEGSQDPVRDVELWADIARILRLPSIPGKVLRPLALALVSLAVTLLILLL